MLMCLLDWVWSGRKRAKEGEGVAEDSMRAAAAAGQDQQDQPNIQTLDQGTGQNHSRDHGRDSQNQQEPQVDNLVQVTSSKTEVAIDTPAPSGASQTSIRNSKPQLSPLDEDDWSLLIPDSPHVRFFRETDWASTFLGPIKRWDHALRLNVFTVLADSRAACVYWGAHRVAIYNEAFIPLAGKTHPMLMGATFKQGFPEIWQHFEQVFNLAEFTGQASIVNDMEMFVERNGFLEEAFFNGNFIPLRGDTGKIEGFYNGVHEVTRAKINERRRIMLNGLHMPSPEDKRRLTSHVIPMLKENPWDFPMAMIYKVDDTLPGPCPLVLRGNIGFPEHHPLAVEVADISSDVGLMPLMRKARWKMLTVPVDESFDGVKWSGFGEPSRHVTILPISDPGRLYGFLIVGANPRRPLDEDYHQFMQDLGTKISSMAGSILNAEETRKREASLQRELADRMRQIRYMAENASVGMQYIAVDGSLIWANDEYYRLTDHPRGEESQFPLSFMDVFIDEDQAKAMENWKRLVQGESSISTEMRLKRMFNPPSGDPEPAIVLIHSFRVVEEGRLKSLMAFTTDVSAFKWAEASEARKAAAAQEAKRQQEEFIDFVSHELRNPLSAIFQLAETIITSFPADGNAITQSQLIDALNGNIDNAKTILMCAKHQKRIVDDVLTLSKLEYTMLSVSPLPVQVPELVDKWMKMFESQLLSADITIKTRAHASLDSLNDDWILCDESRVQQIFINLMTNAIKFTKAESRRQIEVQFGVTASNPRESFSKDIKWAPNHREVEDLTEHPEWGLGEPLYFTISVTDTGIGMTNEEIKKLFGRFKQANARTSIKYGGSVSTLSTSPHWTSFQAGSWLYRTCETRKYPTKS